MTNKNLNIKYTEICTNLAERKLKPAFDQLKSLMSENGLGAFNDEWLELDQTYHYMLQYTIEGTRDPERKKVYRKLIVSAYELADKVNEAIRLKYSSSVEYERKRTFGHQFISDFETFQAGLEEFYLHSELQSMADNEKIVTSRNQAEEANHRQQLFRLFYHVWFRDQLSSDEINFLKQFFEKPSIRVAYKSLIVSALTLSLQRYFDETKFSLLFDVYGMEEATINQRALVGLLITLYQYDSRLPYFSEITGRLKILNEDQEFRQNLERILIQLIRSKETEKLQQRIRDELIPEMIKISPTLKDKINLDSLMEKGLSDDKNPEWQEIFGDSPGLINKMEEFSELQMEGADVFVGSFSMLKSFPFFNEMGNWFVPFFTEDPEIQKVIDISDPATRSFIETIGGAPILCDSDKYSFCFSMRQLPKENLEFIAEGLKAEMDQFKEIENDEELTAPGRKAGFISNQYIQDLYRFYKLHPRKNDFEDIFNWRFDFHNKLTLGDILKEDSKILRNISEYYFLKNYFEEASTIFEYLLSVEKDGELYQKVAFCYQKTGNFEKALESYQKAELYDLNRLWTLKKIALCYRNLKQPAKALEYYQAAEKLNPNDLNNQLNVGHCLLELDQFEEALKCYFKVEYLDQVNKKVWRPIGWCSFLTGKKDQAEKYFLKLLEEDPSKHDLMNMGHVQWSLGNRKAALDFYKKSISKTGFSEAEFMEVFEEDLPQLLQQGVDKDDVPIMLDQLRYFVEE
ncbi:MAG: tetratricopeptide repeat protein [Prolixibacteraceae bacterium]|jgi:tetratricopeptide (TPR) repeat protein